MKRLLCVLVVAFALVGRLDAQLVAYDEFDGSARGGWKQTGLGEWAIDSARLERGAFVTVDGNHWRELAHPVTRATVWYAATFRMRAAPVGYASIVPASDRSSQFSEFGFNSAYGATGFVTAASPGGGPIATGLDATATQTILARYDLASGTWSAWASAGDGRDLVDASGRVVREPLVDDAPLASDSLGFLYLTKGSRQELEVERLALAATARDALTPVAAGTLTQELAPEPVVPPSPGIAALLASPDLRIGERIACYGDSITWQGGWIEVLEKAFARHAPEKHVVFLNRGLNGATSTDLRDGVDDLFGQTRGDFVSELAKDRPSLVVIFVGVNDVSREHAKNSVDAYATAIEELVDAADRDHRRVVVCTPAVIGERKHGANPRDAALDEYALAAMHAAWTSDAPPDPKSGVLRVAICNLRGAFARELERLNTDDRESGVLTYDGVHMLPAGNALIADEIASSLASAIAMPEHTTELGLVPAPRSVEKYGLDRRVGLTHVHVTTSNRELEPQRAALEAQLVALGATVDRDQGAKIELRLDTTLGFRDLYRLDVSSMEITVSATRADIVPYASADLLQLCSASVAAGDKLWVPHATILDGPGVDFRALLVDVARKPHSLRVLKQLVELCHFYKLRYLQLHLTDDQAFTFPSIAFPELVTPEQHYTQAELRELVAYADARGVVLIPELEMPGHCGQLVARKPELFRASPLHHATIDFANPEVVAAMETLVAEACDVFRSSPWFHIGGDECDLEHVADSPHFAPALAREGVANARELYRKFLVHMHAVVKRHGKRTLVWEGFAPGGEVEIPRDLVVVAYEALYYPPDALLRDGYTVVNAAWKPLYVVNDRRWSPREIYGWNRFLWQHFIEGFPAFRGLQVEPNELVLGAMLCAWEQPESAELESLVERVPAFAERLWRPKLRSDFADFERRRAAGAAALAKLLDGVR